MTKNITKAQIPQKDSKVISYPNLVDSESLKENSGVIRNPGTDFRLDKISNIAINKSAVERRCTNYGTRRSIKKDKQVVIFVGGLAAIRGIKELVNSFESMEPLQLELQLLNLPEPP